MSEKGRDIPQAMYIVGGRANPDLRLLYTQSNTFQWNLIITNLIIKEEEK